MMTNVVHAKTKATIAVIAGGQVQQLNAFTVLADGVLIEFLDSVYVEDLNELDDARGGAAPFSKGAK
jgi:hypothetical protein